MTGFDAFIDVWSKYKKLLASGAVSSGSIPLIGWLSGIEPPEAPYLAGLAALLQIICVMISFQLWNDKPKAKVDRIFKISLSGAAVFCLTYLGLFISFTFVAARGGRYVKGFICKPEIVELYPKGCPWLDLRVLQDSQYDSYNLWTTWSVNLVKTALVVNWLLFIAFVASAIGLFLVFQTKRRLTSHPRTTRRSPLA